MIYRSFSENFSMKKSLREKSTGTAFSVKESNVVASWKIVQKPSTWTKGAVKRLCIALKFKATEIQFLKNGTEKNISENGFILF